MYQRTHQHTSLYYTSSVTQTNHKSRSDGRRQTSQCFVYQVQAPERAGHCHSSAALPNVPEGVFGGEGSWGGQSRCPLGAPAAPEPWGRPGGCIAKGSGRGGHSVNPHNSTGTDGPERGSGGTTQAQHRGTSDPTATAPKAGLKMEPERLRVDRHRNKYLLSSALCPLTNSSHLITQPGLLTAPLQQTPPCQSSVGCPRTAPGTRSPAGHPPPRTPSNGAAPAQRLRLRC